MVGVMTGVIQLLEKAISYRRGNRSMPLTYKVTSTATNNGSNIYNIEKKSLDH